jgi:hypothetical protein
MYAWRVVDRYENRSFLTLSANEAEHWDTLDGAEATIVSWEENV